jgi:hypothetical protein
MAQERRAGDLKQRLGRVGHDLAEACAQPAREHTDRE